jgi:hypothetical protein
MKSICRKAAGPALSALAFVASAAVAQSTIQLDFNSLPSAQGWVYMNMGNSATEGQVFSLAGGVLTQNSLGLGSAGQGSNRYNLYDRLTPGQDYTLEVRARLIAEEGADGLNHYGFSAGYFDGTGVAFGFGLGDSGVITDWGLYSGIDTHLVHTYRLVGHSATAGASARSALWIDGLLVGQGLAGNYGSCAPLGAFCNSVYLGDGTGGPNARGEYLALSLTPVPEPTAAALCLAGLAGVGWVARRRRTAD